MKLYNIFDREHHLIPQIKNNIFESLNGWDLGWELLAPINIAANEEEEIVLSKKLSPGQKALYFFWYLDAQVTNGGFIQFYWNGYEKYIPPIIDGLLLLGDEKMIELVNRAGSEYAIHKDYFSEIKLTGKVEALYEHREKFEEMDDAYYLLNNDTMFLLEKYIREHHDDFVKLIEVV